jgi:hypothetical protein
VAVTCKSQVRAEHTPVPQIRGDVIASTNKLLLLLKPLQRCCCWWCCCWWCRLIYSMDVLCLTNAVLVALGLVSKFSQYEWTLTSPQFLHPAVYGVLAAVQLAVLLTNRQVYLRHRFKVRPQGGRLQQTQQEGCCRLCRVVCWCLWHCALNLSVERLPRAYDDTHWMQHQHA